MEKTLLDKIGGKSSLTRIVDHWYERILNDIELSPFFEKTDINWLKQKIVSFLETLLIEGAYKMEGQLHKAHAHLGIQIAHFNAFIGHLDMALDASDIENDITEDIIDLILETKEEILSSHNVTKQTDSVTEETDPVDKQADPVDENPSQNMTSGNENNYEALLQQTIDSSFGRIEFDVNGKILDVNSNFVSIMGYENADELLGKHHSIFVEQEFKLSNEYEHFWIDLANGITQDGVFQRLAKDGEKVWIQSSYTPLLNKDGSVIRIIKIATDITKEKEDAINATSLKTAIDGSFARIEFDASSTILDVNTNFLHLFGYTDASELIGQKHRLFLEDRYADSETYNSFWEELRKGNSQSADFKRFKRNGEELWIQAIYAPVKNDKGVVDKIVKIATDITPQKQFLYEINKVIVSAGEEGKLDARLDASQATGDWKELASSVNLLLESVAMPIMEISDIVGALANGDLTERFDSFIEGDIKKLGNELNVAIDSINVLMGQISQIGNLVAASAEEMLVKGEEMKNTTQEVASATQQMAEGAQQQAQQTDEASKMMDNVLKTVTVMAQKAGLINESAVEGQKNSSEGLSTIKLVANSMNEIQDSAVSTSDSIEILSERSEEIASALSVITDIAAQTNLLALNAAIEAARAGDAGRGFAVVAEEIRKLAEGSKKSAVDIEKVIREIQKDINVASKAIDSMESNVKSGMKASKEAQFVFESIEKASHETLDLSKEIVEATEGQKESIHATAKNIEKIVVVAEETASGTEQVASSSKVLSQGMNEVTATSEDLANVANQLQESISKFKLQ
ncbi:MAG: Methyl-accepting chemotaxis protein [uncultured Aureispira sp.]|uniref:Methyl-accepting chemotaxis protein n=1 Tax=uncultured Aureispira sp. TaxID=1331704 RepID=A0A6S6SF69_9BACT|nr:MAG: Methyl-accepting chemotaxis protein [uncultured Aureispira sp.]